MEFDRGSYVDTNKFEPEYVGCDSNGRTRWNAQQITSDFPIKLWWLRWWQSTVSGTGINNGSGGNCTMSQSVIIAVMSKIVDCSCPIERWLRSSRKANWKWHSSISHAGHKHLRSLLLDGYDTLLLITHESKKILIVAVGNTPGERPFKKSGHRENGAWCQ